MLTRKHETAIRSFPQAQKQTDAQFSGGGLHYPHFTEGEQRSKGIQQLDLEAHGFRSKSTDKVLGFLALSPTSLLTVLFFWSEEEFMG